MGGGILDTKNAFTLIELLAIIVILAIIAVITVPIILNIIENSRKGAATDSAYGYKDAVNKAYVQELSKPNQEGLKLNGIYEVQSDGTLKPATGSTFGIATANYALPVTVSGDKPTSGTLIYENNVLTSGTLIIGDYTATYSNGSFTAVKTSTVSNGTGTSESETDSGQSDNYTYYGNDILDYITTEPTYDTENDEYYCTDDSYDYDVNDNICYKCPNGYGETYIGMGGHEYMCVYEGTLSGDALTRPGNTYYRTNETDTEVCGVFPGGTGCVTSFKYAYDESNENFDSDAFVTAWYGFQEQVENQMNDIGVECSEGDLYLGCGSLDDGVSLYLDAYGNYSQCTNYFLFSTSYSVNINNEIY